VLYTRRDSFKQAQRAEAFLSTIVESAEDAIISKTLDGIITSWNPGAETVFGYSPEEVIGKPVTILIPPEQHNEEPAILAKLRRGNALSIMKRGAGVRMGQLLIFRLRFPRSVTVKVVLSAPRKLREISPTESA
jgi:PAS domain S-box-containing protein